MSLKTGLTVIFLALTFTGVIKAHPLGNFSLNQFSKIEVENSQVKIRQVLDIAEIPTFQLTGEIDADRDGNFSQSELDVYAEKLSPVYLSNVLLKVNNSPVELRSKLTEIHLRAGEGNLPILKVTWDLIGDFQNTQISNVNQLVFENKNNLERIGWNEVFVQRGSGDIKIFNSTAFGSGITDELKSYPQESLAAPLAERSAELSFTTNDLPSGAKVLQNRDGHTSTPVSKDKFAELISIPEITFPIAIAGLLLAFSFGAMHALSPGHGKTVVGAYLVGSRGTIKHAVFLGLTVTITHTIGVFALGLIMLFASNFILPERIMPFLSFVSGLLVFFIGISLFKDRLFAVFGWKSFSHNHDDLVGHQHDSIDNGLTHTHGGSTHTHLPPNEVSWRSLLGLGISGGLLPCPSALVLMLSAINLNRIGYGIILTLVFSFGLAATLTAVGLIFLYGGKLFGNSRFSENRLFKTLPVFSAFVIACVGAVICYNSLI